jgi:hypothetical protein
VTPERHDEIAIDLARGVRVLRAGAPDDVGGQRRCALIIRYNQTVASAAAPGRFIVS